jgi:hypothetical protein
MPGPTISSPRPITEDMELKLINDDTHFLATSQEHEENFMLTGGGSGCAGQDGMCSHLFCSAVGFFSSQTFFTSEEPFCPFLLPERMSQLKRSFTSFFLSLFYLFLL